MDLSCIISSGDLELYVLGMLPEEETYQVEQLMSLFPEISDEVDVIIASLTGLSSAIAPEPSPSVKNNLMAKLHQLKATEDEKDGQENIYLPHGSIKNEEEIEPLSSTPVIPITKKKDTHQFLVAASIIGWMFCIGLVVYLLSVETTNRTTISALQQHADTLKQSVALQQQKNEAYNRTLEMLQSDDYKKIRLTSVAGKPAAVAQVFWNSQTHKVYVADVSLPQPPANKQYQLWAIVDGKPVDAGLLTDVKQLAQPMHSFEKADAFAITLENKGGSPTPTMEEMYVMAKVS